MSRAISFVLFILFISVYFTAHAQKTIYNLKHYSKSDGLVAERIRGGQVDANGILWMATNKGLINFDGFRFYTIPFLSSQSRFINDLSSLSIDPKSQKIWLSTYNEGLICYDRSLPISSSLKIYKAKVGSKKLIKNELYSVLVSSSGRVYFGGQETELQYYEPNTDSVNYVRLAAGDRYETIFSIREDPNGLIWIGTRYGGIYIYNPITQEVKNVNLRNKGENGGRHFSFVGQKVYFNYYDHNLSSLDNINQKVIATDMLKIGKNNDYYDNELTDICYLKEDNKLLLSHVRNGLYLYDIKSSTTQNINWKDIAPNIDGNARINSLITAQKGIYIASDVGLFYYSEELNLINDLVEFKEQIRDIFQVKGKNWYLGTDFIGQLDSNYTRIISKISLNGLKVSQVNVVNSIIYLSTYDKGVYVVDPIKKLVYPLPIEGSSDHFRMADCNSVVGDTLNGAAYLWIGSWNSGLYKYAIDKQKMTLLNPSKGLIDHKVIAVGKDKTGTIWIGMDGFGLIKIKDKEHGTFVNYHHNPTDLNGLSANSIFTFLLDKKGEFWFGSSASGIGKILYENNSNPVFIQYDDPNMYKKLYPKKMVVDDNNRIWIITSNGMMIFDISSRRFMHLENGDGIYPLSLYNPYNFYIKNNQIFWITPKGLIKGKIDKLYNDNISGFKPIASQFRILNEDHSYKLNSKSIVLQPSENSFAFYFACPALVKNSNVRFSYKLSGVHSDWVIADESNHAVFTNVGEGEYNFEFRVGDLEGNWSPNISSYTITVKSFWYQSKNFRIIVGIVIIVMVFGFLFYRIEQQKTLNKLHRDFSDKLQRELIQNEKKIKEQTESIEIERQQKLEADFRKRLYESELKAIRSQMNPHFIFNVLNSIEAYVVENNKLKASKLIHKFAALSRIVLENSQYPMVNIESELQLVELYLDLERERFDNMFDYKIELDPKLDPHTDKIPSMLIQPIVENAVHHGVRHLIETVGLVFIKISCDETFVIIEVFDNGLGFDTLESKSYKRKSFGIKGVEDRLKMMSKDNANNSVGITIKELKNDSTFKTHVKIVLPRF